ncbi:MAG: hypothetical protein PVF57_05910 [Pseudomonadales bacterium]|jgi:hypothetical protein
MGSGWVEPVAEKRHLRNTKDLSIDRPADRQSRATLTHHPVRIAVTRARVRPSTIGKLEKPMKTFLAVFTGSAASRERSGWDALSDDERRTREESGGRAWSEWMEANAEAIVDSGGPLGTTKRVSTEGIADTSNAMAAYVVLRAASHAEAAAKFVGHPHFTIFPGDGVEIMERLPIPEF